MPRPSPRFVDDHDESGIPRPEAFAVSDALHAVTVVDPACGSGAYLLGMMQELIELWAVLYSDRLKNDAREHYDLKLDIIQRNLYGVDSDEFAANIAMLRLWLSLSIDYDGAAEPPPLPNLDFKIVCGDSLLGPDPSGLSLDRVTIEKSGLGQLKAQVPARVRRRREEAAAGRYREGPRAGPRRPRQRPRAGGRGRLAGGVRGGVRGRRLRHRHREPAVCGLYNDDGARSTGEEQDCRPVLCHERQLGLLHSLLGAISRAYSLQWSWYPDHTKQMVIRSIRTSPADPCYPTKRCSLPISARSVSLRMQAYSP